MRIRVLYFATLRDLAGVKEEALTLPEGMSVGEFREHLISLHPRMQEAESSMLISVNREYAFPEELLQDGDEVAVFPPVSGGSQAEPPTILRLTQEALDMNSLLQAMLLPTTGAACVFSGVVRAITERGDSKQTAYLEYEAYATMAETKLRQVADEMRARWPTIEGVAIVQRIGRLDPGTPSILVACTSAHRDMGIFEAARFGIDRLKQIVPIWKKEVGLNGEVWVEGEYHPLPEDKQESADE